MECDMNILLVNGFQKSYFLAKSLCGQGHHITLIAKNQNLCRNLAESVEIVCILGDAGNTSVLEQAEIKKADMVIALSDSDAENLMICELAKRKYHIRLAVSIVNNPANIEFFEQNGIDFCISESDLIDSLIRKENIGNSIRRFLPACSDIVVKEVTLTAKSKILDKKLWEIPFPPQCTVVCIIRNGTAVIPQGTTECKENDKLIILAPSTAMEEAAQLTGS